MYASEDDSALKKENEELKIQVYCYRVCSRNVCMIRFIVKSYFYFASAVVAVAVISSQLSASSSDLGSNCNSPLNFVDSHRSAMCRVPTARKSQRILSESEKVRENREGRGKVREF